MSVDIERTVVYERKDAALELAPDLILEASLLQFVTTDCSITPLEIKHNRHTIYFRPEDIAALSRILATLPAPSDESVRK